MDPLSIAATTVTLATLIAEAAAGLDQCIRRVRIANKALSIFALELGTFKTTLRALEANLKRSKIRLALEDAITPQESSAQLETLHAILKDCETSLKDLNALLDSIKSGRIARGFLRTPATAWKLNAKAPELGRIQNLIKTYNSAIQIHLQITNLYEVPC